MPRSSQPSSLPFYFTGGFDMSTKDIGVFLSIQGFIQMMSTIFAMPLLVHRFGMLPVFRAVVLTYPLLYITIPYLTLVPEAWRSPCIYLILVWKVSSQAFTMPIANMMIKNAAPSKKVLGTIYGVNASAASLSRSFGPTVSGLLQSAGLSIGMLGLPWWFNAVVAAVGSVLCLFMIEQRRKDTDPEKCSPEEEDEEDEEAGISSSQQRVPRDGSDASLIAAGGLEASPPPPLSDHQSSPLLLECLDRRGSKAGIEA